MVAVGIVALQTQTPPAQAASGINQQINYQARLLTNTGAIVPDGDYNLEFKIYQDGTGCVSGGSSPCGGTLKWTETRTSTNKVTVKNGYFSVQLGSVNAFGTSVDWNQDTLWLSINVGGTGTPSWDGEMTPFRRLAAVPYAFNSKQLGGLDASQFVQIAPSAVQVDSGTLSTIFLNKTGASGNILQLQKNGADKFAIDNNGGVTSNYSSTNATAGNDWGFQVSMSDTGAVTSGTDDTRGLYVYSTRTGGSGSAVVNNYGIYGIATSDTGGTSTAVGVAGVAASADVNYGVAGLTLSTGSGQTEVDGLYGSVASFAGFTGTTTTANAIKALVDLSTAGTYTTASGLSIETATLSGGGTIATNYGAWIKTQTVGATNYGLRVDTAAGAGTNQTVWIAGNDVSATTAAKGIAFGSAKDATLYRGGANTLQTDGDFYFNTGGTRTIGVVTSTTGAGNTLALLGAIGLAAGANAGGIVSITGGTGGSSTGLGLGGNGGAVNITGGATYSNNWQGSNGGAVNISGGTPTASVVATNSTGGAITLSAGTGGAASGFASSAGGPGGAVTISAGSGGAAGGGGNQTGGNGGGLSFTAGSGGASIGSAANSSAGNITFTAGSAGTGGGGAAGTAGSINFVAASNGGINIGTNAVVATIQLGNATGATGTYINAGTTGLSLGNNGVANTIQIGNTTGAVAQTVNVGTNATASSTTVVNIGSAIGTSAVSVNCGTGTCGFGNNATAHSTVVGSTNGASITYIQTGTAGLNIANDGVSNTVQIGNGNAAVNQTINIGNNSNASGSTTVIVGCSAGACPTTLQAGSSGLFIGNAGVSNTIQVGNTTGAVSQTINIGNNATASSTNNVNLGSSVAGTVAITGPATITNRTSGSSDTFNVSNSTSTGTIAKFIDGGSANPVLLIADGGAILLQNQTNSAAALQIKDSGTEVLLSADTTARGAGGGNLIKIGNSTGTDGNTTILQVDSTTANPTSNLSALNGGIFYNSTSGKMSIVEGGAVKVLCNTTDAGCGAGGSTTLQSAYAATSGNTIVATDGRDLSFTFADTTTDPNFVVNLQCVTSCGSNGRFAVQSAGTDVFTIAPTGTILATKHSSFGGAAAIDSCPNLSPCSAITGAQETFTDLSTTNKVGNYTHITLDPTANNSANNASGMFVSEIKTGNTKNFTGFYPLLGTYSGALQSGGGNVSTAIGALAQVANNGAGTITTEVGVQANVGGSSGTITTASGFASSMIFGSAAVTTSYGLSINSASGSAVTNNYGIYIAPETIGTTGNYGLAIGTASGGTTSQTLWIGSDANGTTANAGLAFGQTVATQANLYRGADNTLKTDSSLVIAGTAATLNAQADLRLADADSSNWVAFQAPSTVSSNVTWTLPSADSAGCFQSNGSGTVSIAACGDTNIQTFSATGDYTLPSNALMVVVEAWGGGGGGGGGTGGTTAAVRSGGAGGGGGAYSTTIITGSSIGTAGTVVKVTVGAGGNAGTAGNGAVGGDGGAGGATCFSTVTSCSGTMYLQTFGGGGGNGDGTAGNGGGGGGGSLSVGTTNGTAATGGAGGSPLGAAAGAMNSGFGGGGGATAAATGAAGGSSGYGGAGGGSSSSTGAGNSGAGGGATQGGAAGGAGGSCAITTCTLRQGGAGGKVPGLSGGGGTAGTTAGQAGGAGSGGIGSGGDGGGGGANNAAGTGGAGGAGGARGGGGGGGGAGETTLGGAGGAGGAGYLRTWTLRGAGADLAEMYNTYDQDIIAGDVVAIDGSLQSGVKKTNGAYDSNTMGIISTKPGLVLGDETNGQGAKTVMVALAGRVPVKVSMENGPINVGDPLTPSSTPGVAMKATKYGPIIGQAMTTYAGDGPNYVVVFIKNSHANGSKLSDALQSASAKYQDPQKTLAQNALSFFSEEGKVKTDTTNVSEIYTDRVAAASEIISPNVATNNLSTDTVTSATGKNLDINIKESGKISINDALKKEVVSIDDKGNATFKGTLVADKIKANQIEGLEVYTNKLDTLAAKQEQQSQPTTESPTTTSPSSLNISNFTATTATINQDFTANGTLFANGAIKVTGPAEFLGTSVFYQLASFIDKVVFKNNVNFEGNANFQNTITVSGNTAGKVKVPAGETVVKVKFTKPYSKPPVINATPIGIVQPKYGVANVTETGFDLQIDPAQPNELEFNWFAVENN